MNHIAIIEDELETAHQYHDLLESYLHQRSVVPSLIFILRGKPSWKAFENSTICC